MYKINEGINVGKYNGKAITDDSLADLPDHLINSFVKNKIIKKVKERKPVEKPKDIENG